MGHHVRRPGQFLICPLGISKQRARTSKSRLSRMGFALLSPCGEQTRRTPFPEGRCVIAHSATQRALAEPWDNRFSQEEDIPFQEPPRQDIVSYCEVGLATPTGMAHWQFPLLSQLPAAGMR